MMHSAVRVISFAAAMSLCAPAAADDPSEASRREAKEHYLRGMNHYNLGEFAVAIAAFKAAYALSGEADLLFNIAQAHRLAESYKEALYFYDAYLRARPDAPNRQDVESRIADTRALLDASQTLQESPPQGAIPPPGNTTDAPPAPADDVVSIDRERAPESHDRGDPTLMRVGIGTAAVGLVVLAAGTYYATRAADGWDEINELSRTSGTWSDHYADVESDARSAESRARWLVAGGGMMMAAGVAVGVLGWHRRETRATVVVAPTRGAAEVVVTWRF